MSKSNSTGEKIRRIRELRGIKQEELAARVGVSLRTAVIWELSDQLDLNILQKIAAGLGVSIDFIHHFDEEAFISFCIKMQVL